MSRTKEPARGLMDYLPSILQGDEFLAGYLSAFEKILIGRNKSDERPSLESSIADIARQFDPMNADEAFLPWLARWTAFSLRADLSVAQQRKFLAQIISLYSKRGTKANLQTFLEIFTNARPTIIDGEALEKRRLVPGNPPDNPPDNPKDADIKASQQREGYKEWEKDGMPRHSFIVELSFLKDDEKSYQITSQEMQTKLAIARGLIQMEKPAHTRGYINPIFLTMKLWASEEDPGHSTLGVDTLLGDYPVTQPEKQAGGGKQ